MRLLAGRPEHAEQPLRAGLEKLAATDDRGLLATTAAMLAQALYAQARFGDAGEQCALAEKEAAADDIVTQVIWRGVRAKLFARAGTARPPRRSRATRVALVDRPICSPIAPTRCSTSPRFSDNTCVSGRRPIALSLYEQKGNAVGAARARSLLGRP